MRRLLRPAGLVGGGGGPQRPRTESAAAACANAAQYLLDTQEVSPGLIRPLTGSMQPLQQETSAAAAGQQGVEVETSGEAMNGLHANDPEAVGRAVLARLAAEHNGSSVLQETLTPEQQQQQQQLHEASGAVPMDVDAAQAGPVEQQQQEAIPAKEGSETIAAHEDLPAEGTPDETAKEGGKPSLLVETPDREPDQAAGGAGKGNAAADLQLETPLKLDEDIPAAAARDRPDSAGLA